MNAYKAFRVDKNGKLRFLFHTYKGSSLVPLDQWITANQRWVKNGTGGKSIVVVFTFFLIVKIPTGLKN
jgi:hypothetical protein